MVLPNRQLQKKRYKGVQFCVLAFHFEYRFEQNTKNSLEILVFLTTGKHFNFWRLGNVVSAKNLLHVGLKLIIYRRISSDNIILEFPLIILYWNLFKADTIDAKDFFVRT